MARQYVYFYIYVFSIVKWMSELNIRWTLNLNSTLFLNLLPVILVHSSKYLRDLWDFKWKKFPMWIFYPEYMHLIYLAV